MWKEREVCGLDCARLQGGVQECLAIAESGDDLHGEMRVQYSTMRRSII